MSGDNSNQEFEKNHPSIDKKEHQAGGGPRQDAQHQSTHRHAAESNQRTSQDRIAQVREQLERLTNTYEHASSVGKPLVNSESPAWREYQREYLGAYLLSLQLLNERVLDPSKIRPLMYEEAEKMNKFEVFGVFRDRQTGQKWELCLDRKPQTKWEKVDRGGTRISIWDHNERGNRVTSEWGESDYEQWRRQSESLEDTKRRYGDVHDIGWRFTPDGVFSFNSMRNSKWPRFWRENSIALSGGDFADRAGKINHLLATAIQHPESVQLMRSGIKLPRK